MVDATSPGQDRQIDRLLVAGLFTAVLAIMLDASVTCLSLPNIRDAFNTGNGALIWVQVAASLATAAIAIQAGAFGDRYGRSRTFLAGVAIFVAGALLSALASGPPHLAVVALVIGRVLAGAGGTIVSVLALALLTSSASAVRTPEFVGLWTALTTTAGALSSLIAGLIIDTVDWRIGYGLPAVLMAAASTVVFSRRPQHESTSAVRLTWRTSVGFAFVFTLLISSVIALEDTMSTTDWTLFAIGIASLIWLRISQWRSDQPIIPWSDLRSSGALSGLLIRAAVTFTLSGAIFETTFVLLNGLDYSPTQVGAMTIAPSAAMAIVSLFASKISTRIGTRSATAVGCLGVSLGIAGLGTITASSGPIFIVIAWSFAGASMGLLLPTLGSVVLTALPQESQGRGSGMFLFTAAVANVVGVSVVSIVATRLVRGIWSARTSGPCGLDDDVLSNLGAGAFTDIGETCGPELASSAKTIYIHGATSVIQVAAILLGVLTISTWWTIRRTPRSPNRSGTMDPNTL